MLKAVSIYNDIKEDYRKWILICAILRSFFDYILFSNRIFYNLRSIGIMWSMIFFTIEFLFNIILNFFVIYTLVILITFHKNIIFSNQINEIENRNDDNFVYNAEFSKNNFIPLAYIIPPIIDFFLIVLVGHLIGIQIDVTIAEYVLFPSKLFIFLLNLNSSIISYDYSTSIGQLIMVISIVGNLMFNVKKNIIISIRSDQKVELNRFIFTIIILPFFIFWFSFPSLILSIVYFILIFLVHNNLIFHLSFIIISSLGILGGMLCFIGIIEIFGDILENDIAWVSIAFFYTSWLFLAQFASIIFRHLENLLFLYAIGILILIFLSNIPKLLTNQLQRREKKSSVN